MCCTELDVRAASIFYVRNSGNAFGGAYHHFHASFSIDSIHIDVANTFVKGVGNLARNLTYNSSRQRRGDAAASHTASRRQICENDFSPPDKLLGSLSFFAVDPLVLLSFVRTYRS